MERTSPTTIVLVIAAILILGAVGYGAYAFTKTGTIPYIGKYLGMSDESARTAYTQKFTDAISAHTSQDFDTAIAGFEALLPLAPSKTDAALVKNRLAINLVNRGFKTSEINGDVRRGMELLWELALDRELPPDLRANALGDLATIASLHTSAFYRTYYTVAPFNELVKPQAGPYDTYRAALNIFLYADDVYPSTYSKYSVAKMHTHLLSNGVFTSGSAEEKESARSVQQYISEGDALYAQNPSAYAHGSTARMLLDRAQGLTLTGRILDNKTPEEREAIFKETLDRLLELDQGSKYVTDVVMETRFWYAGVIMSNFGEARAADIREILAPFKPGTLAATDFHITRTMFVQWGSAAAYTNFGQSRAVALAEVSTEFRDFLVSVGWKL